MLDGFPLEMVGGDLPPGSRFVGLFIEKRKNSGILESEDGYA